MTPLEIAAKAAINKSLEQAGRTVMVSGTWPPPEDIAKAKEVVGAALLALAGADLPESLMDIALDAQTSDGDDRHCFERGHFRAMCRAIAEDRG